MGRLEFVAYRRDVRRTRRRLISCYESLSVTPDLDAPFVFVALQCQPERQASPNGDVFVHQNLMVELLSATVPSGWKIYVKEHLSQFNDYQTPERGRTELFYRDMAALPNVELVPMWMRSFDLIDNARAAATVSGTVGWEAVNRGTPALMFGYGWYRGCEGVFHTQTAEECRAALRRIADGYIPDPELVRRFAGLVERHSIIGYVDPDMAHITGIPPKENARNIADAILGRVAPSDRGVAPVDSPIAQA